MIQIHRGHAYVSCKTKTNIILKLQPDIFPLSQHIIRFHELPADTTQCFYNRAVCIMHRYCIMLHRLYASNTIDILVDWTLNGLMTSILVICESESPRPRQF